MRALKHYGVLLQMFPSQDFLKFRMLLCMVLLLGATDERNHRLRFWPAVLKIDRQL